MLRAAFLFFTFAWALTPVYSAYDTPLTINEHTFEVDVARTSEKLARGLMEVKHLESNQGMLFLFGQVRHAVFWMKNTPLNLDLAFIDRQGHLVQIESLVSHSLKHVPSHAPVWAALELPQGTLARHHLQVGDHVVCATLQSEPSKKGASHGKTKISS